jgi:hypothetical protein
MYGNRKVGMKSSNGKTADAARKAKRHLENSLTEAQQIEKVDAEVERQRKIQRKAVEKNEESRVEAERRSTAWVGDLAAEATRNSYLVASVIR